MRVGIDCRMMGKGFGIARYVEQLVFHLKQIDGTNEYVLFTKSGIDTGEPRKNFKVVNVDVHWYSWQEQLRFANIIKRQNLDLAHFPHWNAPIFYNRPFVATIHDLIMFHYPRPEATTLGPVKFWLKDKAHRLVVRHAVKKSKHLIATSEFTKFDAHNSLGVPLEKMDVTYQAPFICAPISNEKGRDVLRKYGVNKPFVMYVGAAYPHKNLEGLIAAWQIFKRKFGLDYQLVLVGRHDYFYKKLINSRASRSVGSVVFTGFVSDSELVMLYEHAELYVFPSMYEGFGLPPLEAMSRGVPVVSSNGSCLPEVLGEAALYFDPKNYAQMAEVIHQGLINENVRHELKEKAKAELKRYSWRNLAKSTLEIYMKSLNI